MNDSTTPVNERNEWRTPEALFKHCASLVGGFDFDTACTLENAVAWPVWYGATHQDALIVPWMGRCFCNPPYDNITPWVEKALHSKGITVMVIPSPNGEKMYHRLLALAYEVHIIGRVSFIGSDGKPKNGNPRGTSIFLVNGRWSTNIGRRDVLFRSTIQGSWDRSAPVWAPPCS